MNKIGMTLASLTILLVLITGLTIDIEAKSIGTITEGITIDRTIDNGRINTIGEISPIRKIDTIYAIESASISIDYEVISRINAEITPGIIAKTNIGNIIYKGDDQIVKSIISEDNQIIDGRTTIIAAAIA